VQAAPVVICVTPVRNEAWILPQFLACANLWADHIVIGDHASEDGSREIAAAHPKVTLIEHNSREFMEEERRAALFEAARRIPGPRLIVSVDADERLSGGFRETDDWRALLSARPGTVGYFYSANLQPGLATYWRFGVRIAMAFVDDGRPYQGRPIHPPRVPVGEGTVRVDVNDFQSLHYSLADTSRVEGKYRWYQCLERFVRPERDPVRVFRAYHHQHQVRPSEIRPVPDAWFAEYDAAGIDRIPEASAPYWYDREVVHYLEAHGAEAFRRAAIWDVDWVRLAESMGVAPETARTFRDPRRLHDRLLHAWLRHTQWYRDHPRMRQADRLLSHIGW